MLITTTLLEHHCVPVHALLRWVQQTSHSPQALKIMCVHEILSWNHNIVCNTVGQCIHHDQMHGHVASCVLPLTDCLLVLQAYICLIHAANWWPNGCCRDSTVTWSLPKLPRVSCELYHKKCMSCPQLMHHSALHTQHLQQRRLVEIPLSQQHGL